MHTMFDEIAANPRPPVRRGSLVAAVIALSVLLAVGIALIAEALMESFENIESASLSQKAHQVYRAFESDLRQLEISNRDYAEWDDAERYARNADPKFIEGNFSATTLNGMLVNVVWIVDASGKEMYSGILGTGDDTVTSPAPGALLDQLRPFVTTGRNWRDLSPARRLVRTPAGLVAFSSMEIRRSDLSHATGSVMLFARLIGDDVIQRTGKTSELPVHLVPLSGSAPTVPELPRPVAGWLHSTPAAGSTFVSTSDDTTAVGYALIQNASGHPVALFETATPRTIYALGFRITWHLLGAIAVLFAIFAGVLVVMIVRLRHSLSARHAAHQRYRNITAQMQEFLILADPASRRITAANPAVLRALGCTGEQLCRRTLFDVFPDLPADVVVSASGCESRRGMWESRMLRSDGTAVDTELSIAHIDDDGNRLVCLAGRDITHRRVAEELQRMNRRRLSRLADQDALTGLPNRRFLQTRLPRVLARSARSDRVLGVIYLDIDHFKKINDSLGHGCGDQLLQVIGKRLRATVSAADVVVRMGGDEFVIVLCLMPNAHAIGEVASRLQVAAQAPVVINGEALSVSASMGIALYPQDGVEMDSLLKFADIALYQAKEAGRRCHRFFTADMDVRISEQVALEQALRHAIGSDQLYLEYQPIMDLQTGFLASMEALMRWRHPELGLIPPGRFIPIAEQGGLVESIGEIAIRRTIDQLRQWIAEKVPVVPIAVNVSPLQLEQANFVEMVDQMAFEAGVDMGLLRFEITESAVAEDADRLIGTLRALRDRGCKILVDDFGTGYSNLSHLARLPVDTLKIDRAFVNKMETDSARASIVRSVIGMARELNLTTTAEGVETAEQLSMLSTLGCTHGQGYYYSRPVSARDCTDLLRCLHLERGFVEHPPQRRLHAGTERQGLCAQQ